MEASIRARIGALAAAIPRVPQELARAAEVVSRDVNSGRPGLVIGILAVLIAVGFGAEWLVRRALARARGAVTQEDAGQAILSEIVALLTFALASVGSFLAFEWPPLLRRIILTLLLAFIAFRVVRTAAGLLFAFGGEPSDSSDRPTQLFESEASTGFWRWRVSLVAGFLFFGWAIASLMPDLGFSREVAGLAAFLFGLGILATAIDVVWRRPDGRGSLVKRSFLTLSLIVLWVAWVAGLLGVLWLGIFALVLPTAVRGVGTVAQAFAGRSSTQRRHRRHAQRAHRQRRQGTGHRCGGRMARLYLAAQGRHLRRQRDRRLRDQPGCSTASSSCWSPTCFGSCRRH